MSSVTRTPSVRPLHRGQAWFLRLGGLALLGFLLLSARAVRAQNAPPAWTLAVGAQPDPALGGKILATALDADGNVFVVGQVYIKMQLGSLVLAPPYTDGDGFVAKYSPASGFVWAVSFGSNLEDAATSLAVRGHDVYVGGYYRGAALAFGGATVANAAIGSYDGFVGKLTDNGASANFGWAQRLGGTTVDKVLALAVSGSNGVLVAGSFRSTTATLGTLTLTNIDGVRLDTNAFVAKLTDAGTTATYVWAQRMGGSRSEALAVAAQGTGVVVAGYIQDINADFGSLPPLGASGLGGFSGFVTRLTDAGSNSSFAWAQAVGRSDPGDECRVNAVALNGPNVYVAGHFNGYQSPFGTTLITSSNYDGFLAKLTDAGSSATFGWATKLGGGGRDYASSLATQGRAVYVAGVCVGNTVFGSISLPPVSPSNSRDVYVARLTDAGSSAAFDWVQHAGGPPFPEQATSLAVGGGRVYVGGTANGPGTLQFGSLGVVAGTGVNYWPYLASLTDNGPLATAPGKVAAPLSLWPNPAHGAATVRLPAGTDASPLLLLDELGRTVRHFPVPASGATDAVLDLRGLPVGQYVLHGAGRAQRLSVE